MTDYQKIQNFLEELIEDWERDIRIIDRCLLYDLESVYFISKYGNITKNYIHQQMKRLDPEFDFLGEMVLLTNTWFVGIIKEKLKKIVSMLEDLTHLIWFGELEFSNMYPLNIISPNIEV